MTIRRRKLMYRLLILLLLSLLFVSPVMAEGKGKIQIGEVVVTATRYAEELKDVPAHVSVITEGEIQNSTAQTIPDILRTEAGIHVNDSKPG
jgi:outer membrane cobalamin receptor